GPETSKRDDLGPLFGFVRDEVTELGRRARKRCATQVCQPRLELGIAKHRVDLLVELLDDIAGGALRRADTGPVTCLEAWYEITTPRHFGKGLRAGRGRYCEGAQPARFDVFKRRSHGADVNF